MGNTMNDMSGQQSGLLDERRTMPRHAEPQIGPAAKGNTASVALVVGALALKLALGQKSTPTDSDRPSPQPSATQTPKSAPPTSTVKRASPSTPAAGRREQERSPYYLQRKSVTPDKEPAKSSNHHAISRPSTVESAITNPLLVDEDNQDEIDEIIEGDPPSSTISVKKNTPVSKPPPESSPRSSRASSRPSSRPVSKTPSKSQINGEDSDDYGNGPDGPTLSSVKNMKNFWDRMVNSSQNGPANGEAAKTEAKKTESQSKKENKANGNKPTEEKPKAADVAKGSPSSSMRQESSTGLGRIERSQPLFQFSFSMEELLKGPKESIRNILHEYSPMMLYTAAVVFCIISGMIKFSLEQPYSFSLFRLR